MILVYWDNASSSCLEFRRLSPCKCTSNESFAYKIPGLIIKNESKIYTSGLRPKAPISFCRSAKYAACKNPSKTFGRALNMLVSWVVELNTDEKGLLLVGLVVFLSFFSASEKSQYSRMLLRYNYAQWS